MRTRIMIVCVLCVALATACASLRSTPRTGAPSAALADTFVESGFLTLDYSLLTLVKPGEARRIYENPNAPFSGYDKIFIDRITIWRDDDQAEPVRSAEFQKVVDDLYASLSREVGKTFTLVQGPGPGVGRMRVALVAIDHPDDRLDVYVSVGEPSPMDSDEALPTGLREFGRNAWMEAEMLDAVTKEPIFAIVDRVADVIPHAKPIETWQDLHRAFNAWAKQGAQRMADLHD